MFNARFRCLSKDDISKPNVPVRTLTLTQGIGNHQLIVYASEFVPLPNDKTSLKWRNAQGVIQELKLPPYCLTNIPKVTAQIRQYIRVAKQSYLDMLNVEDDLVSATVVMATDYARTRPVSSSSPLTPPCC